MKLNSLIPELYCTSIKESLAFYVDLLEFKILYQRKNEGFAMLEIGDSNIMLDQIGESRDWMPAKLEKPFGRGINLSIDINNVRELYKKIIAAGIKPFLELEEPTYNCDDGKPIKVRQFIVSDPDGYLLRFTQDL